MRKFVFATSTASALLVLASCSAGTPESSSEVLDQASPTTPATIDAPSVVVTTTILGSVVGEILQCALGNDSSMTVLMPVGADPHDFQASSAQVAQMASADLVVVNGLGLEEGVLDAVENLEADGVAVLEVAALVDPLPFGESAKDDHDHGHDHGEEHSSEEDHTGHDHGEFDPHFWFDMDRMALAAELIGENLPSSPEANFVSCGESVAEEIRLAEEVVAETLASVPEANRVLVTDHDALGYLAARYGYDVVGVVIPGGSTLGDPNSQELAELVAIIQQEGVRAIFGDQQAATDLLGVLSDEVGGDVAVVELFVGSLGGPGSGAESYVEMMTTNATRIASALAD